MDDRRYPEWVELFAEDAVYWVPAGDESSPRESVALIYDSQRRLKERLTRMASNRFWAQQPPTRTCRIIGNVIAKQRDDGEIDVECRSIMSLLRRDDKGMLSGACYYRLRPTGDSYLIVDKTVRLIERDQHFDNLTFLI